MNAKSIGTVLVVIGVLTVLLGLLVSSGWLNWFGRLPGDIRIERENVKLYIPLVSMLLLSVVLSLLLALIRRF